MFNVDLWFGRIMPLLSLSSPLPVLSSPCPLLSLSSPLPVLSSPCPHLSLSSPFLPTGNPPALLTRDIPRKVSWEAEGQTFSSVQLFSFTPKISYKIIIFTLLRRQNTPKTMSKAKESTKFRKVDVDALENQFDDEQGEDVSSSGPDEGEVNSLLASKKNCDALKIVLASPPLQTKNQAAKDKAFQLVMRVLTATRPNEVDQAIKGLDNRGIDILMKYIYRGFAEPTDNSCGILLTWHEKAVNVGGLGCIVRVLADRKTV